MSDRSEGYSDGYAAGLRWGKRDGDRIAAETLCELHRVQADRDRLAATVERVRALIAEWEQRCEYYRGTGNFRTHRYATDELLAAIEGTDS